MACCTLIPQALAAGGPVVVILSLNLADPALQSYSGGLYNGRCDTNETVAMLLVAMNATTWTARASWGVTWGREGHITLPRGVNFCGISDYAFLPGETAARVRKNDGNGMLYSCISVPVPVWTATSTSMMPHVYPLRIITMVELGKRTRPQYCIHHMSTSAITRFAIWYYLSYVVGSSLQVHSTPTIICKQMLRYMQGGNKLTYTRNPIAAQYDWKYLTVSSYSTASPVGVACGSRNQSVAPACSSQSVMICQETDSMPYQIGKMWTDPTTQKSWCMYASNGQSTSSSANMVMHLLSTLAPYWWDVPPPKPVLGMDGVLAACRGTYQGLLIPGWTDGRQCSIEYNGTAVNLFTYQWLSFDPRKSWHALSLACEPVGCPESGLV